MDTALEWLPRPTYRERVQRFQALLRNPQQKPAARFSEFLTPANILFFHGHESKIQIVEALVETFQSQDRKAILQAIWQREREGALGIQPDISVVRGRMEKTHHIQAALAICPKGVLDPSNPSAMTRVFALFVGPITQTHLHTNLVVAISALFHNRHVVERVLKLESPEKILEVLRQAEGINVSENPFKRFFQRISDFVRIRYGWGSYGAS